MRLLFVLLLASATGDKLGFKGCPQGFQLATDGGLISEFGELEFTVGGAQLNSSSRLRRKGSDSSIEYRVRRDGAIYDLQMVVCPLNRDPSQDLIAFVHVRITNGGATRIHAPLVVSYGPIRKPRNVESGCPAWYRDKFMDAGKFKNDTGGDLGQGVALKHEHLVFAYSGAPMLDDANCSIQYGFELPPGASAIANLKIPLVPIDISRTGLAAKFRRAELTDRF